MSCFYEGCANEIEFICVTCQKQTVLCLDHSRNHRNTPGHKIEFLDEISKKAQILNAVKSKIKQCIKKISEDTLKIIKNIKEMSKNTIRTLKLINKNISSASKFIPMKLDPQFISLVNENISKCVVCCVIQHNLHILNPCKHSFCYICFELIKEAGFKNKNLDDILSCPGCNIMISPDQYNSLFDKQQMDKITALKLEKAGELINCFKCRNGFQIIKNTRKQKCPSCGESTCEICNENFHEVEFDCLSKLIEDRVKMFESFEEEKGVTQCPGCRYPCLKDPYDEGTICINPKCLVAFCFYCACFRSPALSHGNHYHRPDCKYFNDYDGADDEYNDKCERCRYLGRLCPRPKRLKVPRRVAIDEVESFTKSN